MKRGQLKKGVIRRVTKEKTEMRKLFEECKKKSYIEIMKENEMKMLLEMTLN